MAPVTCSSCGKTFAWNEAQAGQLVKCTCGTVIQFPLEAADDFGAYDIVTKPPAPTTAARIAIPFAKPLAAAEAEAPPPSTGMQKPKPTLAYRTRKEEVHAKSDPETLKNLTIPLWLLAAGVPIEIIAAFIRERDLRAALTRVALELFLGTSVMLAGILAAAKLRRIDLGQFWIAVFKLAAISVAPSALLSIFSPFLNHIPFGGIIGWVGAFAFYFALLGVLFDLDESDTWYCVFVIFIVNVAVYFLLLWWMAR